MAHGIDCPSQSPAVEMAIDEVGITNKTFWVPLDTGLTPFDGEILLGLPGELRGIHMSRIEEAIDGLRHQGPFGPVTYGLRLVEAVLKGQPALHVLLRMDGKIPISRVTPVTGRTCLEAQWVGVEVKREKDSEDVWLQYGTGISHITACPCTQAYNEALFGEDCPERRGPGLPTHSQKCHTKLSIVESGVVEGDGPSVGLHELLMVLEGELIVVQSLLKRPDEAELVFRAHAMPQFVEDVVRHVAKRALDEFSQRLGHGSRVVVESLSLESIHSHDVKARMEITI